MPYNRYERKYITENIAAELLKRRIAGVMRPDAHSGGRYLVNNIYFDDIYGSFYYGKLSGAYKRDKYRLRWYNNDTSFVRLERKRKEGILTSKDYVTVTEEQFYALSNDADVTEDIPYAEHTAASPMWNDFLNIRRLRRLKPSVSFSYTREAYIHESGNARITFDSNIAENLPGARASGVIEVKYSRFLPCFIKELLDGTPLAQTEMSKYCAAIDIIRRLKPYGSFA